MYFDIHPSVARSGDLHLRYRQSSVRIKRSRKSKLLSIDFLAATVMKRSQWPMLHVVESVRYMQVIAIRDDKKSRPHPALSATAHALI
jgi:hypothetical protein